MDFRDALKFKATHAQFILGFPLLLYGICNGVNIDKLSRWFYRSGDFEYVAFSAYLLAGLCLFVFVFALLAHRRTLKPVAVVLTLVSACATYFISKYNVAIDASMVLNAANTDPTEVRQLLSWQMLPYVVFLMIIPTAIIFSIKVSFGAGARYLLRSSQIASISLVVALAVLYLNFNAIHRAGNVSNKYIVYSLVPINILSGSVSAASKTLKPYFASNRHAMEITGSISKRDDLIVVLAIGETSRRRNFSLYGYDRRNTNPVLQTIDGLHLLNGVAKRGTTLDALPEILARKDVTLPAITSSLGIPTACFVNYTLYENCATPGETKVVQCGHGGRCYDEDVLPLLQSRLKSYVSGYNFVVLHLGGGSHGPTYNDRHPPEFQRFTPMCNDADVANRCTLDQLYNSYDNTILYVDHVLGGIIRALDASRHRYVFIYLSDHGESLMENGRMFHGMPPGIELPPEQAEVPLIVKSSVPISIAKRDVYRQQDVFDTVLDLFTIETSTFDESRSFIKTLPGKDRLDTRPPQSSNRSR